MFKITDILSLGSDYTVSDSDGKVINTIQVIPLTELLAATLGPYTDEFGSYENYMEKSIATLSGFDDVDSTKVLWYATEEDEVALSEIIEYAINHNYDKIILEHLE
jgi:hypothetical protein